MALDFATPSAPGLDWATPSGAAPKAASGSMKEALLPRMSKAQGPVKKALGAAGDVSTGLLRVPAAGAAALADMLGLNSQSPAFGRVPEGYTFKEALDNLNQGNDEFGQPSAIAKVGNDPATVPSTLAGLGVAGKAATGLGRIGMSALGGLAQGAASGVIHEGDKFAQGHGFSPTEAAKEGGLGALVGGAFGTGAEGAKALGGKIVKAALKPGHMGQGQGFDVENVFKNGLGGSFKTMTAKTEDLLKNLRGQQSEAIAANANSPAPVGQVFYDVLQQVGDDVRAGKHFGDKAVVADQLQKYANELRHLLDPRTGVGNLELAWTIKKKVQNDATRLYTAANRSQSTEELARQKVSALFAKKLTEAIEAAYPEVTAPNKQFSEVIPIAKTLARRNVIAGQNNPISLDELAAVDAGTQFMTHGDMRGGILPFLVRGAKSPAVGNAAYQMGKGIQDPRGRALLMLLTGKKEGAE